MENELSVESIIVKQPTLLDENTAQLVSNVSTCTRLSIRVTALISEILMESAKYSTSVSIQLSRRVIINALAAARNYHLSPINGKIKEISDIEFTRSLDHFTDLGIYIVHQSFTLVELFAMSSFHFFSNSFKSGLWLAEESVRVLDGLFGSTETSRALASIVMLVKREIYEDDEFLAGRLKNTNLIAALTKALTAFACLQNITTSKSGRELQLVCLFQGHVSLASLIKTNDKPKLITASPSGMVKSNSESCKDLHVKNVDKIDSKGATSKLINNVIRERSRARRSKSFSSISRKLHSLNTNGYSSGMVELLDQSENSIDKNMQNQVGEKAIVESGSRPFEMRNSHLVNPNLRNLDKLNRKNSKLLNSKEIENNEQLNSNSKLFIPNPTNLLSLIYRFMRYSSAAYGSHFMRILGIGTWEENDFQNLNNIHINHYAFARHTSTPLESILFSSYSSVSSTFNSSHGHLLSPAKLHPLVHYVAVDHAVNAIVLTCRGTLGISDALTDLTCDYMPIKLGGNIYKAHSGMLNSALALASEKSEVHSIIAKALTQYPGYGLVLCGHSLGGGVVSLLSALWGEKTESENGETLFVTSKASQLPNGRFMHCFTYGVPPALTLDGANYCNGLVTSLINQDDIVACLSLGILRDFKNITTSLMNEEGLPQLILQRILGLNGKLLTNSQSQLSVDESEHLGGEQLENWFWSLIKTMRADMQSEKLYPPGEVYIINYQTVAAESSILHNPFIHYQKNNPVRSNSTPSGYSFSESNSGSSTPISCLKVTLSKCTDVKTRFSEITFSKSMFADHSPRSYEDNLDALNKALTSHS
ncbi:alpha/beta-hydrolase [Neoconidiobolus thromboides FSU 785]|nr:alpha/beta-hydrolase [Neoconidiobolus thromboides FSU 785]